MNRVLTWIKRRLTERYSERLERIILVGSRAKNTNHQNSDWDVVALVTGYRTIFTEDGDIEVVVVRHKWTEKDGTPDGNNIEVVVVSPEDFSDPRITISDFFRDALECGQEF